MDPDWWKTYKDDAAKIFKGEFVSSSKVAGVQTVEALDCKNSGMGALLHAYLQGAELIILLGFDGQKTDGKHHWHGDHVNGLPNPKDYARWHNEMSRAARQTSGIEVINATAKSAYNFWPQIDLDNALKTQPKKDEVFVNGMHGLGDALHERAVVRELIKQDKQVWISTSFPDLFYDLPVKCVPKNSPLPPQRKNEKTAQFISTQWPRNIETINIQYNRAGDVEKHGSVLAAMSANAGVPTGDFRIKPKQAWLDAADELLFALKPDKPIMFYRPLIERPQHKFCRKRNPDHQAYEQLVESIRDKYFVISVADATTEKIVCLGLMPDADFTDGSLSLIQIYGLIAKSDLVFNPVSFATVLAQSMSIPCITVFGGYESSPSLSAGSKYSPWLGIDPIKPCLCLDANHNCDKKIDLPKALSDIKDFVNEHS